MHWIVVVVMVLGVLMVAARTTFRSRGCSRIPSAATVTKNQERNGVKTGEKNGKKKPKVGDHSPVEPPPVSPVSTTIVFPSFSDAQTRN